MTPTSGAEKLGELEPLRTLLRYRYRRRFRTAYGEGCWLGDYPTLADALRTGPAHAPLGYDHSAAASLYDDLQLNVQPKDYPVLYWLQRSLVPGSTVFDLGGNAGASFYAYQPYLAYIAPASWTIRDLPSVIEVGRQRATRDGVKSRHFTSDFTEASGRDLLFTAGTLQYIESPLHVMIDALAQKPEHYIVNMLPTTPDRTVITLQNIGVSFCPYRIIERRILEMTLRPMGYTLEDSWINPESRTRIPYAPSVPEITWIGQYFRRRKQHQRIS